MHNLDKLRIPLLILVALTLTGGLVAIPLLHSKVSFGWFPILILLICALLLVLYHKGNRKRIILALTIVGIMGWVVEAIGVNSVSIFGYYTFGERLGPKIFGVPLLVSVGWAMVAYMAFLATSMLPLNNRRLTASAGLMVFFDIMLEPSASRLGLWQFKNNDVPFQNYVVWFLLGMLFLQLIRRTRSNITNSVAVPLFVMLMVFFLLLNIIFIAIRA